MKVYGKSHNSQRPFGIAAASVVIVLTLVLIGAGQSRAAVVFSQDFESGLGPNETTFGAFQINNTNPRNNGTFMMGHPSFYGNNEYSFYEATLDLTDFEQVRLQFEFTAIFERHYDRFNLQVGVCPINPPSDLIEPVSGMTYINSDTHRLELGTRFFDTTYESSGIAVFDLSEFDLEANVCARFQFGSDHSVTSYGINFDNILVTGSPVCSVINAIDDHFSVVNDGTTADFDVVANDDCQADEPISVVVQAGDLLPDRGGSATTDGATVSYTPAAGFNGREEFTYTAQDAGLQGDPPTVDQDTAWVVVDVYEDFIPDAVDDVATTLQDQDVIIDVLENDFLENAPIEVAIETDPANGSATLRTDDTIEYSPYSDFFGEDSFEYRLTDANGDSDVATVTVGVFFVSGPQLPIDIMPNSDGNNLNLRAGQGAGIDIAILSIGQFFEAPNLIDPLTLKFGPREGNIWGNPQVRDVDGDGDEDLVVKFLIQQTGIPCGATHAILFGRTFDFQPISGMDAITTFNCPRVRKRH